MVKIRLARHGSKNHAFYRIVAIDERKRRSGKPLDIIGTWNPTQKITEVDKKKLLEWIKKGAQVSQKVKELANL